MSAVPVEPEARWSRPLITPEGMDLRLNIASGGQRATAFFLDILFIIGAVIVLTLLCLLAILADHRQAALVAIGTLWLIGFFFLRNVYFIGFEMGARGSTPGKRLGGLRVASRSGEALTAGAIFARNAMREIEIFLPLTFLVARGQGVDAMLTALGLLWSGFFAFFPLLNKDRLRIGDIVAGTWVVHVPKRRLVADLVDAAAMDARPFDFSQAQLDVYGVKELQVLEGVLRGKNTAAVSAVAERIRAKITWVARPGESDFGFLDAYYLELRRRLEQQMLLGRRRRDKHDVA